MAVKLIEMDLPIAGHRTPLRKIAKGVFLRAGTTFYLFRQVNLCRFASFHGFLANRTDFSTVRFLSTGHKYLV